MGHLTLLMKAKSPRDLEIGLLKQITNPNKYKIYKLEKDN